MHKRNSYGSHYTLNYRFSRPRALAAAAEMSKPYTLGLSRSGKKMLFETCLSLSITYSYNNDLPAFRTSEVPKVMAVKATIGESVGVQHYKRLRLEIREFL
jgi:hypothetical protein